ncbi:polysaccharide deacetylase family protein [Saccharothrix australiensis]|uniref:Peptidoglycan/xylan/chitin deacetylase (PgdA/CDA1 family) n=1 Tax=Saccharothrix australiensis TaxID=2072 RepID=A0A495VYI5_9PSEU|nr:polysaccharide deacetylase family protein [Saccharothrix australiensis]RKT54386.1 peptidoglycan/xylan/chitin deacetylase (PgdA/CDA1 family) [Saccharothrix australiensis]
MKSPRPRTRRAPSAIALAAAVCCACGAQPAADAPAPGPPPDGTASSAQPAGRSASAAPDAAAVGANELGQVPVLMYHRFVAEPTSVYDRTPDAFRAELERLANEGYVPVTATEYATGRIDIPAGRHPVVLTFDDGDPTQLTLGPDGRPAAGSAIAILLDVASRHPGFRPVASVYVNAAPFGTSDGAGVLPWLRDNGFEVGNHTRQHTNLSAAGDTEVQQAIAAGQREIQAALPGYAVQSLALPFGARPTDGSLALRGAADGTSYEHTCVLLVGAGPAPSPYAADFDPASVPRIRSQDASGDEAKYGSTTWLDHLAANPATRYTSDGVADRIAYPSGGGVQPAQRFADRVFAY